ncbi:glycosyltransferase family 4 protein [Robertmurraya andreesenii]|uniref:Glycosyltransferase involved in cell wall biosynthesis n=1 Tax=Anoxybacillus andreesenii TaxID=1325932 RepID=A0ABT9V3D7_9BACL|nr:glycosyltransferase family 4 protein [Robertmurraya andreesenii]MDQ0155370.1 glycosyltransferase involved in cell wall biosynthesis [Robertmurraya andreesenii]
MKKKLVFISNMAAPYQVKFCYSLQKHFDTEFWFYVRREAERPKWWEIPLGEKCKILRFSGVFPKVGYFSFGVFSELIRFKPDIVMLGGFMRWHWLLLIFAKFFNKKVIIMSEPLRNVSSDRDQSQSLMNKVNSSRKLKWIKKLFSRADLYVGMGTVAEAQFIEEIEFEKSKVTCAMYPLDIEMYFEHTLRAEKPNKDYTLLFANRLIDRYQPLFALEVFKVLKEKYPNIRMLINNDGPLRSECIKYIKTESLQDIEFITQIDSWNNMHKIYEGADILILPATYSNGNGTIVEATASGMGIVVSNQINHLEFYARDSENCFICNLEIESFAEAIEKYIEKPALFLEHGNAGRQIVEYLKNENTAKKYVEIFERYGL